MRRVYLIVAVVLGLCLPSLGGLGEQPLSDATVAAFISALEADGFTVQRGDMSLFPFVEMCCTGVIACCNANNVMSLHMAYRPPLAPDQTVPKASPFSFRLRPDEAMVLIGSTPPPVAYFSYEPFCAIRTFEGEGVRRALMACIGDTVNLATLEAARGERSVFNQPIVLISTPDRGIDGRVRAAATASGMPEDLLETVILPGSVLRLGLDVDDDELLFAHRMALPEDPEALATYVATPQLVLRLTPKEPTALEPFPTPDLRVRGTGTTEMDLIPALEELRAAILAAYPDYEAIELTTSVWLTDGFDGLQRGVNYWAPTRDALYLCTEPFFQLPDDPNCFAIVYGVNHVKTGKATYCSFALYADPTGLVLGIAGENDRTTAGSASDYLLDHPQAEMFYAWKIARRSTSEPHVLALDDAFCARLDLDSLPDLWVGFRLYLEPGTAVGPAFAEILYDRVIVFRPKE